MQNEIGPRKAGCKIKNFNCEKSHGQEGIEMKQ